MAYVDGFVIPVPTAKREDYRALAQMVAPIFKEHGALSVVECWGDDVPLGTLTSFPRAVHCEDGESVVFSWIIWPNKAVRDAGNAKIMADPRMQPDAMPTPFDGKRLIFGGFEIIVEA